MTDEPIIQVEDGSADETETQVVATDTDGSPSDVVESERTTDVEKADESVDDDEYEPFKHEVRYKAADEDKVFELEYDRDGNLTSTTTERLTQVLAKTGLEKVAQEKHDNWQRSEKAREVAEARIKALERQMDTERSAYKKPIEFIRQNPHMLNAMKQRGVDVPDLQRMELERREQNLAAGERVAAKGGFMRNVGGELFTRYPHLNKDHFAEIGQELFSTPFLRRLDSDPNANLDDATFRDVLLEADRVVAKLVMDGKLPNPTLDKARADTDKARKEVNSVTETARKRASVVNPLAGGKPRGTGGGKAIKAPDMQGWTASEASAYYKSGGKVIPQRG